MRSGTRWSGGTLLLVKRKSIDNSAFAFTGSNSFHFQAYIVPDIETFIGAMAKYQTPKWERFELLAATMFNVAEFVQEEQYVTVSVISSENFLQDLNDIYFVQRIIENVFELMKRGTNGLSGDNTSAISLILFWNLLTDVKDPKRSKVFVKVQRFLYKQMEARDREEA